MSLYIILLATLFYLLIVCSILSGMPVIPYSKMIELISDRLFCIFKIG